MPERWARHHTMKRIIVAALAAALLVPATAGADRSTCSSKSLLDAYSANWHAVKRDLGKRAPGRNIRRHGLANGKWASCKHLGKSLRQLRKLRAPALPLLSRVASPPKQAPAGVYTSTQRAPAGGILARIAQCESGGNPRAIGGGGRYRGKFQFDYQTWASVGGSGDPAAASEAEQDKRAAILYGQRGAAPWPVCGR